MNNYSFFSKLLHRVILNSSIIKKTAFDLDCLLNQSSKNISIGRLVYISGLARAGTTIILKTLYDSNKFASLTYQNMPLITAPQIWKKINYTKNGKSGLTERAHGDGLLVNQESPESFEEIFWKTFSNDLLVKKKYLHINSFLEKDVCEIYKKFVKNILSSYSKNNKDKRRYLSKNNNILRIKKTQEIFPEAKIIIPFRDPVSHAGSLFAQHKKFIELQKNDSFIIDYMNWLGHFEFGLNFKPFLVNESVIPKNFEETLQVNYWLKYWIQIHRYLIENFNEKNVIYLNHESLSKNPRDILLKLEKKLSLEEGSLLNSVNNIKTSKIYSAKNLDQNLIIEAEKIYSTLMKKSL